MFSKSWHKIPAPLKSFILISIGAAATVLLAPAAFILIIPPLFFGGFYFSKYKSANDSALYAQRWSDMASYHIDAGKQAGEEKLGYESRNRIRDAVAINENGIASAIHVRNAESLRFTPAEALAQDFKTRESSGVVESMQVQQYGMLSHGKRVATINIVIHNDEKIRIEVQPEFSRKIYVLDAPSDGEDTIIDIPPK